MANNLSRVIYRLNDNYRKLNENANNPSDLQVGQEVTVNLYDKNNTVIETEQGIIELIMSSGVIVRSRHSNDSWLFTLLEYNAHEDAMEYVSSDYGRVRRFYAKW